MSTSSSSVWSIAVKTVGLRHVSEGCDNFMVSVMPDDDLSQLQGRIEDVTGIKPSQQRLIYRGRLINSGAPEIESSVDASDVTKNEPKVRDVVGLCDGETIHLVPRPAPPVEQNDTNTSSNSASEETADSTSARATSGTASLLAALLGLDDDDEASEDATSSGGRGQQLQRLRNAHLNRIRRPRYRLTASDLVVPDPGSMEPVRQGLMTLHTLLQANPAEQDSPWDPIRHWYRGQWIDCRDTVNQWLEATIVDIVRPEDILPEETRSRRRRAPATLPARDVAVGANDYEGRRRLLLETWEEDEEGERERANNEGVQLLLIHYNGWPHRWDEWIRSDSERIRPFRTRTRHPSSSTSALPAPQSVYNDAPSTYIKDDDDETDRAALLPELNRALSAVNDILKELVSPSCANSGRRLESSPQGTNLPWLTSADDAENEAFASLWPEDGDTIPPSQPRYNRRQLQMLSPLLDRLGRTLTDAAPHVATLAATLPDDESVVDVPSVASADGSNVFMAEEPVGNPTLAEDNNISSSTGSGLFSLLSRESRRRASALRRDSMVSTTSPRLHESGISEELGSVDPDYTDFVNGMVNTTRGEVRSSASRRGQQDDGASLLSAYLAAASLSSLANDDESDENGDGAATGLQGLGRLLRQGGGGGGGTGIDIHIHAVVRGAGPGGTLGVAMLGPAQNTNMRSLFAGASRRNGVTNDAPRVSPISIAPTDEDDMGIFSELYSENPTPLDPHGNIMEASVRGAELEGVHERDMMMMPGISSISSSRSWTASIPDSRSPSRRGSASSQSRHGSSPRRGNSLGRMLRRAMGRRSS